MKTIPVIIFIFIISNSFGQNPGVIAYSITPPNDNNEIFIINADGTGLTQLTNYEGRDLGPAWSPDASKIAFYAHSPDETKWSIFVMDSNGANVQQLTNMENIYDNSPTWSPDGSKIAFAREYPLQNYLSEIWMMNANGSDQHMICSNGGGPDWSDDGFKITFYAQDIDDYEIYTMNIDGSNILQLTFNNENDLWPDYATGGNQIVFQSERDGNYEIYKMDSNGENQTRLTFNPAIDSGPVWSPDASFIAFDSFRDGNYEIYIMTSNGDDQERLTYTNVHAIQPTWKPITTSVNNKTDKTEELIKVFPNPSNSQTTIIYSLNNSGFVNLSITDSSGKLIKTLVNNRQTWGSYEIIWDGMDNSGNVVLAGIYFLKVIIHKESYVQKLIKY